MSLATPIPGLYYSFVRPQPQPSPLRTDVAGFMGRTQRGPVGEPTFLNELGQTVLEKLDLNEKLSPDEKIRLERWRRGKNVSVGQAVRVEGLREYEKVFGHLISDALLPYAVRGYFDNGGQVAYVVRLLGKDPNTQEGAQPAKGSWQVGTLDSGKLNPDWPGAGHFRAIEYLFKANSPGRWANDARITARFWANGASGKPEVELEIVPSGEPGELLSGLSPDNLADEVNARSIYVEVTAVDLPAGLSPADLTSPPGPRYWEWPAFKLDGGTEFPPTKQDYLDAIDELGDQPEIALVASPDLYPDLATKYSDLGKAEQRAALAQDQTDVLSALLIQAEELHDRLVIIDVPSDQSDPMAAVNWVEHNLRESDDLQDEKRLRNGAVYHPRLLVPDPLGGVSSPLRCVPCSGLVAGVISRMDDQLGAYFTPANAEIDDAVDLSRTLTPNEQSMLYAGGINLLKCSPGRGLLVWGGRVLGQSALGGAVAHRRLIHLLVRAIRRVAEPLVFDTNGPELWLKFVRSITSVLLEAYRAGALKGETPAEAFQVTCDATNNPPENIDLGLVTCFIQVAPAVPMEFILLRVSASKEGKLEFFES